MAEVEVQRSLAAPAVRAWIWLAAANTVLAIAAIVFAVFLGRSSDNLQRQQLAAMQKLDRRLTQHEERLAKLDEKSAALASGKVSPQAADAVTNVDLRPQAAHADPAAAPGDTPVAVDASRDRLIAELMGSVVLITALDDAGNEIGAGSGFVVGADGLVATNYHVLAQAAKATAKFRDNTVCKIAGARAFAVDADLAIVQLESPPAGLRPLKLAGEESPAPGSEAIAIGHPGGFEFSTTAGVVSAIHATANLPAKYRKQINAPADQVWVQTTAVIAGGSSGGPLLNAQGEVLGVN
ncbi:MAG TPA: serine protease, partial [Pirellulales bacterium]|nr:serine protease [Pirellulales bacterium]